MPAAQWIRRKALRFSTLRILPQYRNQTRHPGEHRGPEIVTWAIGIFLDAGFHRHDGRVTTMV